MKFLVIDDESLIRRALCRALISRKHTVDQAEQGQEGLDLWLANEYDLVFLDLVMPDLSGLEVLKRREQYFSKLIIMSAFSDEDQKVLESYRPSAFLKKPFENIFDVVVFAEEIVRKK
jgi:DNA-binding response OmpR family regulator